MNIYELFLIFFLFLQVFLDPGKYKLSFLLILGLRSVFI